jgi:hypothetical protein
VTYAVAVSVGAHGCFGDWARVGRDASGLAHSAPLLLATRSDWLQHVYMPKPMFRIEVLLETDDQAEIDRIFEAISEVVCPFPVGHGHPDHDCPVPWFIVGSEMSESEAGEWRELLNR